MTEFYQYEDAQDDAARFYQAIGRKYPTHRDIENATHFLMGHTQRMLNKSNNALAKVQDERNALFAELANIRRLYTLAKQDLESFRDKKSG